MLLGVGGRFIQVGAPEDALPPFNAFSLIAKGVMVGGSAIGSPADIRVRGPLVHDRAALVNEI